MTKLTKFSILTVLVLTAGLALAAVQRLELNSSPHATALIGGLVIAPRTLIGTDTQINAHRITRSLGATATVDFAAGTILCDDSAAISVVGARIGDTCEVGEPGTLLVADGGAVQSTFSCRVSTADNVKIRHCPAGTADDPLSGSFKVRVISSQ